MATLTCHTGGCGNAGVGIDADPTNPDTGEPVDLIICGACGQPITDVT
jgi:hypothetical protein